MYSMEEQCACRQPGQIQDRTAGKEIRILREGAFLCKNRILLICWKVLNADKKYQPDQAEKQNKSRNKVSISKENTVNDKYRSYHPIILTSYSDR